MLEKCDVENLCLGMRVTPRPIWNGKESSKSKGKTIRPLSVMNLHLELLDQGASFVYYGTDLPIDSKKMDLIDSVLFFSFKEEWAALCDVEIIENFDRGSFVPNDITLENSPEFWLDEPNKIWIKIFSYSQIDFKSLDDFKLINSNRSGSKTLGDLIASSTRFNRVYLQHQFLWVTASSHQ